MALVDELLGDDDDLDVLVVTHPDRDHYNYIADVIGDREIGRAVLGMAETNYRANSEGSAFITWLDGKTMPATRTFLPPNTHDEAGSPNPLFQCDPADVYVLAASVPASSSPSNAASIVLMFEYRVGDETFKAVLTGDATRDTEAFIQTRYELTPEFLHADLLKLGHHGTDVTSTDPKWIETTQPRYVFSSAGHFGGSLLHPRCEITRRALASPRLATVDCHQLECARHTANMPFSCSGGTAPWCDFATTEAIYNTYNSGDLTFTFAGAVEAPRMGRTTNAACN